MVPHSKVRVSSGASKVFCSAFPVMRISFHQAELS